MTTYTEKEASKRWCPFSRTMVSANRGASTNFEPYLMTAINRGKQGDKDVFVGTCIGSRCMLWQWSDPSMQTPDAGGTKVPTPDRRGFCGMGRHG